MLYIIPALWLTMEGLRWIGMSPCPPNLARPCRIGASLPSFFIKAVNLNPVTRPSFGAFVLFHRNEHDNVLIEVSWPQGS